jgi:DNA-binding transcriptional regulator YiaG
MIRSIRAKLNLSQAEFAALIGVNGQSVYQWEHKEGRLTFRGNTKAAIVALRKLNRKEAQQRLEALRKK